MWLVLAIAVAVLLALDALRGRKRSRPRGPRKPRVVTPKPQSQKPDESHTTSETEDLIGIDGCPGGWAVAMSDRDLSTIRFTVGKDISTVLDPADAAGA